MFGQSSYLVIITVRLQRRFEDDSMVVKIKRLIVNMPTTACRSEFASFLFPSWLVGNNPKSKIIQTTHNTELAVRFGRKMKNRNDSDVCKPKSFLMKLTMSADSKAWQVDGRRSSRAGRILCGGRWL